MPSQIKLPYLSLVLAALALGASITFSAESEDSKPNEDVERLTVSAAKERAKLLHNVYSATLDTLHHHYFHANKSVLPARAMEDIFETLDEESKIKANWISVNTNAMSVHHEPDTDFEKKAARALSRGSEDYERIENGYYYRAGPIALGAGCVSCHTGFFSGQSKTPRMAGLVIGIPVETEE